MAGTCVVGMNLAAGVAYLAVVIPPNELRLDLSDRIVVPGNDESWAALRQFSARLVAEVRRQGASIVGIGKPVQTADWSYEKAFTRARLEVAAGLALDEAGVELVRRQQLKAARD